MSRKPRIPPAARSPHGPGGEPKGFADVTHRVRHKAERALDASDHPPGGWTATTILTLGSLIGFALGLIVSRSGEASA